MRALGLAGCLVTLIFLGAAVFVLLSPGAHPHDSRLRLGLDLQSGAELTYEVEAAPGEDLHAAVDRAALAFRDRLHAADVPHTLVTRGASIVVELAADEDELERARRALQARAVFELRHVDDASALRQHIPEPHELPPGIALDSERVSLDDDPSVSVPYLRASGDDAKATLAAYVQSLALSEGRVLALGRADDWEARAQSDGALEWRTWVLGPDAPVNGAMVAAVSTVSASFGAPAVTIELDEQGAAALAAMTRASLHERIAMVLNDEVIMAPVVHEPIDGGTLQISLGDVDDPALALDLATRIRAAALPVTVHPASEVVTAATGPATANWMLATAGGAWLVLALAFVVRYRAAAILAAMPLAIGVPALAVSAGVEATLTIPMLHGMLTAIVAALAASLPLAEWLRAARRGRAPKPPLWLAIAIAIVAVVMMLVAGVGSVGHGATSGPARAFALGMTVTAGVGVLTAVSWAVAVGCSLWPAAGLREPGPLAMDRERSSPHT